MMINEIAKRALAHFKDNNYIFTPDEYQEVFCKEAKKARVIIKDCETISKYISRLNKKYQLIAKEYNIKNLNELISFLIHNLNKEDSSKEKENLENLFIYTKKTLNIIATLPIAKSKKIAIKHLEFVKPNLEKDKFDILKKEWFIFLSEFDDSIIKKASLITKVKNEDAVEIIKALLEKLEETPSLNYVIDAIIYTLTPSYTSLFVSNDINLLKKKLKKDSSFIMSKAFEQKLKILTEKRIEIDKEELNKKLKDLDAIAKKISIKILGIIEKSDNFSKKVKDIANEIKEFEKDNSDFEAIKEKLLTITSSLDNEITYFKEEVQKESEEIEALRKKFSLKENIKASQKEMEIELLIDTPSKKTLLEEIDKQEDIYQASNTNYSVIFFDIDNFKNINDTFGYEARDIILQSIETLLKKHIRGIDLAEKYGGEKFMVILPNTNKEGVFELANKIKDIIESAKFIYKDEQIDVTISVGIAERKEVNSKEELLKLADDRLYKAKKSGRNKIIKE